MDREHAEDHDDASQGRVPPARRPSDDRHVRDDRVPHAPRRHPDDRHGDRRSALPGPAVRAFDDLHLRSEQQGEHGDVQRVVRRKRRDGPALRPSLPSRREHRCPDRVDHQGRPDHRRCAQPRRRRGLGAAGRRPGRREDPVSGIPLDAERIRQRGGAGGAGVALGGVGGEDDRRAESARRRGPRAARAGERLHARGGRDQHHGIAWPGRRHAREYGCGADVRQGAGGRYPARQDRRGADRDERLLRSALSGQMGMVESLYQCGHHLAGARAAHPLRH